MSTPPRAKACINHPGRYAQSTLGLCRKCERIYLADQRTTQDRDNERLTRRQAKLEELRGAQLAALPPRQVTVGDRDYDVMWPRDWGHDESNSGKHGQSD